MQNNGRETRMQQSRRNYVHLQLGNTIEMQKRLSLTIAGRLSKLYAP